VYQTNDLPLVEQQTGKKFVLLDLVQYGVTVPGMALVSTDTIIAKKADALRKFLRATAQGIQDARRSPEEAARIMIKSWPAAPPLPVVTAQVKATLDAIPAVSGRPIGWIDEATIRQALELLKSAKEVETTRPPTDYYTNALLEGA
jgi:NitT/TauT family transport system substrate-binding protein